MMVEEQGEVITQIESHAQNAEADVEQGVKHIDRAIILARSTRAVSGTFLKIYIWHVKLNNFLCHRKNGAASLSLLSLL